MPEFVIDTQIIVRAGLEDGRVYTSFLAAFLNSTLTQLAIDEQGTIQAEYDLKIGSDRFGKIWLKQMATNARIAKYKKKPVPKGVRVELLDKLHFDPSDIKFVETTSVTPTKRLVAEDDDYSPQVKKLLKKKNVANLYDVESAQAEL